MVMDPIGGKSFARKLQVPGADGTAGGVRFFGRGRCRTERKAAIRGASALAANAAISSPEADGAEYFDHWRESGANAPRVGRCCERAGRNLRMYTAGKIKPVIGKTFPLAEAAAAHQYIQDAEEYRQSDSDCEVTLCWIISARQQVPIRRLCWQRASLRFANSASSIQDLSPDTVDSNEFCAVADR